MQLSVGAKLGQYEIAAWLGARGMEEVYKAREKWLNRGMAIKVLPHKFSNDETCERFQPEARRSTVASVFSSVC